MSDPTSGPRRPGKRARFEPDAALARAPGVQYRYTLSLADPADARGIFQVVHELGAAVCYLLLVRQVAERRYRAYLGLGSECFDLPLRLAARGIQLERGEQVTSPSRTVGEKLAVLRLR